MVQRKLSDFCNELEERNVSGVEDFRKAFSKENFERFRISNIDEETLEEFIKSYEGSTPEMIRTAFIKRYVFTHSEDTY